MEVIGAIASFIAIGQAIGATPKIIKTLRSFTNASTELVALTDELEYLYVFYEHLKENVDLFSSEHNPSLLRVEEPPYLKLIRRDLESLMAQLQGLADSCANEDNNSLKASKLRWWIKRRDVTRLRDECRKQRKQLEHMYMLFRDQLIHKQGQLLVHIHAHIPQVNEHISHEPASLPPTNENDLTPPDSIQDETIVTQNNVALQSSVPATEGTTRRRCRCPCHTLKTSSRSNYSLHIPLPGIAFLSYQSQRVVGDQCKMNCCAATQSFVALQFCVPTWLRNVAMTGSFKFGFPLNIYMSLTPITRYSYDGSKLGRICYLGKPDYFNQWLSHSAPSILSVDIYGESILEDIVRLYGYSLLTHCTTTWPGLIKGTEMGRKAAYGCKIKLMAIKLSADDQFHLSRFIQFMEIEDDEYDVLDIIYSEDSIQALEKVLLDVPDVLTRRCTGGHTLLDYACMVDDAKLIKHILFLDMAFNLTNTQDSPLHIAIYCRSWQSAQLLVEQGHPLNVNDRLGWTPLMSAVDPKRGIESFRFAKTLLLRGADAGVLTVEKNSVWHLIGDVGSNREEMWELYEMLFKAGAASFINSGNIYGLTPLGNAIVEHNVCFISFLRKFGARVDAVDQDGRNLLHSVAIDGDSQACQLTEELEISCIDIRTTTNNGFTPLERFRWNIHRYHTTSNDIMGQLRFTCWYNARQDKPGEEQISKSAAFESLLRSIRDRMLTQEIKELEAIMSKIHAQDLSSARDELRRLVEGKVKAKIDHEAETFRAIDLDVRMGRLELAVESIQEFIEASRDRMLVSPFDEEPNLWELSDSESECPDDS